MMRGSVVLGAVLLLACLPLAGQVTWVRTRPDGRPFPTTLYNVVGAYSPVHKEVWVPGGIGPFPGYPTSVWRYDGMTWRVDESPNAPPLHFAAECAFDEARGVLVVVGGRPMTSTVYGYHHWEWNGSNWKQSITPPQSTVGHALAYDKRRKALVLFGGIKAGSFLLHDELWECVDGTFRRVARIGQQPWPSARAGAGMAYDEGHERMVMFGGMSAGGNQSDTWTWDGTEWKELNAPGPSARQASRMYYDPELRSVMLVGGLISIPPAFQWSNEVWELRDGAYRRRYMLVDYPDDLAFCLAYHGAMRRAVIAGVRRSNQRHEVWELRHGVEWIDKPSEAGPGHFRWSGEGLPGSRLVLEQDAGAFAVMLLGHRASVPTVLNVPIACTKTQLHPDPGLPLLLLPWIGNRMSLDVPALTNLIGAEFAMHGLAVRKEPCVDFSWGLSWLVGKP